MFTGLVEDKGALTARTARSPGARISVRTRMAALELGESISVDGVCLTVAAVVAGGFEADVSAETLAHTTLGALHLGADVNLERAMPLGGRMGGHVVTGHVDAVGKIAEKRASGEALYVAFSHPRELAPFVAVKGSIAVNGTSLTVNEAAADRFSVVLIPHTRQKTSLDTLPIGAGVNLEVDVLARYVARQLELAAGGPAARVGGDERGDTDTAWRERLGRAGYT